MIAQCNPQYMHVEGNGSYSRPTPDPRDALDVLDEMAGSEPSAENRDSLSTVSYHGPVQMSETPDRDRRDWHTIQRMQYARFASRIPIAWRGIP